MSSLTYFKEEDDRRTSQTSHRSHVNVERKVDIFMTFLSILIKNDQVTPLRATL